MQADGYATAFLGKWHMGNDPTPRPGFDYWVGLPGQGRSTNPELFEGGRLHEVEGYTTDILTDRALGFIQEQPEDQPWMVYLSHKAVHPDIRQRDDGSVDPASSLGYVPAPRHRGRYDTAVFDRRPNVVGSPDELAGKPAVRRALANRASPQVMERLGSILDPGTSEEGTIRRRAEMLLAVDEGLGRIMEALEVSGTLDRTLIVFTSDNGFFFGEHGLSLERRLPYEESIRNPLIMRYPPLAAAGSRPEALVVSADLAPTVLEAAGVTVSDQIQGRSLVPVLSGRTPADWRESLLVEFYTLREPHAWLLDMDYRIVRTDRYKYIHWTHHPDLDELYDLEQDPFEMSNLIGQPDLGEVRESLRAELGRLTLEAMGSLEPPAPKGPSQGVGGPEEHHGDQGKEVIRAGEWVEHALPEPSRSGVELVGRQGYGHEASHHEQRGSKSDDPLHGRKSSCAGPGGTDHGRGQSTNPGS